MQVRAALEASGLDHGPISVHDKMRAMGLPQVPSTASLARIFRRAGVTRLPSHPARSRRKPFDIQAAKKRFQLLPPPTDLPAGTTIRRLASTGTFMLGGVIYMVGGQHGFQQVLINDNDNDITVADLDGVILIEHTRPAPGVTYVGNGRPRGRRPSAETSPKS